MSRWARRVIEIKTADASFNFRDDEDLVDFLDSEVDMYSNLHDSSGMIDVPLNILREAVRKSGELNLSEETIKRLKEDIKAAKLNNDESVTYCCF
jgi:hypothetical protein